MLFGAMEYSLKVKLPDNEKGYVSSGKELEIYKPFM
jgi:hypothetical protein